MLSPGAKRNLIKFVKMHENPAGGFNFPKETPASIAESYNGVMLFVELGIVYDSSLTKNYVRNLGVPHDIQIAHLYRLAELSRHFNLDEMLSAIREAATLGRYVRGRKLSAAYYCCLLEDALSEGSLLPREEREYILKINKRKPKYIDDCQKLLVVNRHLDLVIDVEPIARWIRSSQNGDGGFGFLPGSTSFLENVHSALDSLRMIESCPRDIVGCREFVLRCTSKDGGFGRQHMALPSLEHSLLAVRSLKFIDEMTDGESGDWD